MNKINWVEDDCVPGAGMSQTILGHATLSGGQVVLKKVYFPGPFHAHAYGEDSPLAQIKETYRVWCNHVDVDPPELTKGAARVYGFPSEEHPHEDACVWFMEFDDEDSAVAYAETLPGEWWD